ncbi:acetate--CoA ligase family protein [Candidatus Dojkabacteria bacterium]|nr:acetate--CoA ligase family protein [Candidatus Dojkabacteria bacterium]
MPKSDNSLENLFNPESIAIIGVSKDPDKIGSIIYSNICENKFPGRVYLVNPKHKELYGHTVYESVKSIPEQVDLACISVPAPIVEAVIDDCIEKDVKAAIIISAGFSETGEQGTALEEKIAQKANKAGLRILGPNCLGMMNPSKRLNASFAASSPLEGNIAFLSQSGAFCTAVLDMSLDKNLGFSHFVSLGNKADIEETELIEYFCDEKKVNVIGAYLEEVANGQRLIQIAKKTAKPIVVFKPGESSEAKKAISSHTGSLAGSAETIETAFKQAGIVQVRRVHQMFNVMMAFSWSKPLKGNRIAVVTNAGGPGIIATDDIVDSGLKMAEISQTSKKLIEEHLPSTASVINPIDVIGDALAERYKLPIEVLAEDENVDAILVVLTPQLVTQIEDTAKLIINTAKLSDKPIFPVFLGGKYVSFGLHRLYDFKIPAFQYISDAVDALSLMYKYYKTEENLAKKKSLDFKTLRRKGEYELEIAAGTKETTTALPEPMVQNIAEEFGIDTPHQQVVTTVDEALEFGNKQYPVVIKATTEDFEHKTEYRAIHLDIHTDKKLREKYFELEELLKEKLRIPNPKILIQEQIQFKEEFFLGSKRDGDSDVYETEDIGFGHIIALGKGGIYTETYKDINYFLVPASDLEIEDALKQTKIWKIIKGTRGQKPLAYKAIINTIQKVQKMLLTYPQIESLDLNPILVTKDRAVAVDIKIFTKK